MRFYKILLFIAFVISFSSCKLFKANLMLKTPKDFTYDEARTLLSGLGYFEDTKESHQGQELPL